MAATNTGFALGASVKDDRANENKLEIIEQSYPTNRSN